MNRIVRYLKSRDWNVNEAEKMLKESIEYKRKVKPQLLELTYIKHDF
jgi:hypothetical protein